jgi:hypothetical protein
MRQPIDMHLVIKYDDLHDDTDYTGRWCDTSSKGGNPKMI